MRPTADVERHLPPNERITRSTRVVFPGEASKTPNLYFAPFAVVNATIRVTAAGGGVQQYRA